MTRSIRRDALEAEVEGRAGDAFGLGIGPQLVEKLLEGLLALRAAPFRVTGERKDAATAKISGICNSPCCESWPYAYSSDTSPPPWRSSRPASSSSSSTVRTIAGLQIATG